MENTHILDAHLENNNEIIDVEANVASKGKRFLNFIIDYVIVFLIFMVLGAILGATGNTSFLDFLEIPFMDNLVTIATYALYATTFETLFGKSVGKFITRTKVVTMTGEKPGFINLLGRNFARFIPFNHFSFLGSAPVGWHDTLSKTRVIND